MAVKYAATGSFVEGENAIIKAQITTDGGLMVSNNASGSKATLINVSVFDITDTPSTAVLENWPPTITNVFVTDEVGWQTWALDSVGYNFLLVVEDEANGGTIDFEGGHSYVVEITITTDAVIAGFGAGDIEEGPIAFSVRFDVKGMAGTA